MTPDSNWTNPLLATPEAIKQCHHYITRQTISKYDTITYGKVSEWFMVPVLKTGGLHRPAGSNPVLSAIKKDDLEAAFLDHNLRDTSGILNYPGKDEESKAEGEQEETSNFSGFAEGFFVFGSGVCVVFHLLIG